RVSRAAKCRELRLQRSHFRSIDELTMRQHAAHRLIDCAAKAAALGGNVDKRNGPLVEAGMRVHNWIQ
ncbi:MAG: hypothetical protein ACREFC_09895, partial [Stellaceae bacterium]